MYNYIRRKKQLSKTSTVALEMFTSKSKDVFALFTAYKRSECYCDLRIKMSRFRENHLCVNVSYRFCKSYYIKDIRLLQTHNEKNQLSYWHLFEKLTEKLLSEK